MVDEHLIPTTFTLLGILGGPKQLKFDLPRRPGLDRLREIIVPLLSGRDLEHVSVLHEGRAADMFVGENSASIGEVRNEAATRIYRAYSLQRDPKTDPESLQAIYGLAVIADRRVWW